MKSINSINLRSWQQDAFERFQIENKKDFLVVANPGSGKTNFALYTALNLFVINKIKRLVIVCPILQLKEQWSLSAKKLFGINISPDWQNQNCLDDENSHGVAITYQQVCSLPEIHRLNCYNTPTMVIFDEIHHTADTLKWGEAIKSAFEYAEVRISLSGTPFRNDNNTIPFINYIDNKSQADYTYTYGQSLRDKVCRYIFFPSFEGEMKWESFDNVITANFETQLNTYESAKRLRTALSTDGDWLKTVIKEAENKLNTIRNSTHSDAGGLIVAVDQFHAKQIANLIYEITGEMSVVAISEDKEAVRLITEFANSSKKWIVSVKMISEGVDIPRLRVGIYATNCISELFFRQVVGRFIRIIPDIKEQNSYLFIPKDNTLKSFALNIMKEREHNIKEDLSINIKHPTNHNTDNKSKFTILSSSAVEDEIISADGDLFSPNLINFISEIKLKTHIDSSIEEISKNFKIIENTKNESYDKSKKFESINKIKFDIKNLAIWLENKTTIGVEQIHSRVNQILGLQNNSDENSHRILQKKLNILSYLKKLLKENNNG